MVLHKEHPKEGQMMCFRHLGFFIYLSFFGVLMSFVRL